MSAGMDRRKAYGLLFEYQRLSLEPNSVRPTMKLEVLNTIAECCPLNGEKGEVVRRLHFAQGVLYGAGWFNLAELKTHLEKGSTR